MKKVFSYFENLSTGAKLAYVVSALILLGSLINSAHADAWIADDTEREAAFLTAHLINWGQQRSMARNDIGFPRDDRTGKDVDVIFLTTGVAQLFIAYALPEEWRETFQHVTIGVEVGQVARNLSLGASFKF